MRLIKFALKFLNVAVSSSQNGYFVCNMCHTVSSDFEIVHTTVKILHIFLHYVSTTGHILALCFVELQLS